MPKFKADSSSAIFVKYLLSTHGKSHLRTRHRADVVTIESGPDDDVIPHARLKRVGVHLWILQIADRRGRWESTPVRSTIESSVTALVEDFGWVLMPFDDDPLRTSDQEH